MAACLLSLLGVRCYPLLLCTAAAAAPAAVLRGVSPGMLHHDGPPGLRPHAAAGAATCAHACCMQCSPQAARWWPHQVRGSGAGHGHGDAVEAEVEQHRRRLSRLIACLWDGRPRPCVVGGHVGCCKAAGSPRGPDGARGARAGRWNALLQQLANRVARVAVYEQCRGCETCALLPHSHPGHPVGRVVGPAVHVAGSSG
jgi:hypothetical protein